jgi:hypothetical protein
MANAAGPSFRVASCLEQTCLVPTDGAPRSSLSAFYSHVFPCSPRARLPDAVRVRSERAKIDEESSRN